MMTSLVTKGKRMARNTKKNSKVFDSIFRGMEEAIAFAEGNADLTKYRIHVPAEVDVKAIREHVGMTQPQFAARYGFNVARLRDWEQDLSHPDGALRAYLMVISRNPHAVDKALLGDSPRPK